MLRSIGAPRRAYLPRLELCRQQGTRCFNVANVNLREHRNARGSKKRGYQGYDGPKPVHSNAEQRIMTPEELFNKAANVDFNNILAEYNGRQAARYHAPNKKWLDTVGLTKDTLPHGFLYRDSVNNRKTIYARLCDKFGPVRSSFTLPEFYFDELNVGDVVDLSQSLDGNDLAVVAQLPSSLEDTRYTLVKQNGELSYTSRTNMGLRIPQVFPAEWFENAVMEEKKFIEGTEYPPVGKPKYKIEDDIQSSRMFDSVIARASIAANVDVKCYILPSILSGIVSSILSKTVGKAWRELPEMNLKLEVLHNILQCNEAPVHLSLYQLWKATELTDLNVLVKGLSSNNPVTVNSTYKDHLTYLHEKLGVSNEFDQLTPGRSVDGDINDDDAITIDLFYAFILALRKNNQIFQMDQAANAPSFVTVVPLQQNVKLHKAVNTMKQLPRLYNRLLSFFSIRCEEGEDKKVPPPSAPLFYYEVVDMMKLYIAGSFEDRTLESFVIKVVRSIERYKDVDISRSTVYDLLVRLGEARQTEDPMKWSYLLPRPGSGISSKADMEQGYHKMITEESLNEFIPLDKDLASELRVGYSDDAAPIYCIDSKDALEIDDGVSVEPWKDGKYLVSSSIANPTSYILPDTIVGRIAFNRGQTLYLPEASDSESMTMMPEAFTHKIQLGSAGKDTRIIRFKFVWDPKTKQVEFLDEPVEFGNARRFVKVDYDSVDEILSGSLESNKILFQLSQESGVDSNQLKDDLSKLYEVSSGINSQNTKLNPFEMFNIKKDVDGFQLNDNGQIVVNFRERGGSAAGRSDVLVSEIMKMSNNVAGKFFVDHNIPAVFKTQNRLPVSAEVEDEIAKLTQKGDLFTFKDLTLIRGSMTKSSVCPFSQRHETLDSDAYATVTSPLRRYSDMVNHWQLQSYLSKNKKDKPMSESRVNYLVSILKFKDELNRKVSTRTTAFYMFKALKALQDKALTETGEAMKFKCIVTKKPTEDGSIDVTLLEYGVHCSLHTSWYHQGSKGKSSEDIEIGDVIEDAEIEDVDFLDGSIVLRSDSF